MSVITEAAIDRGWEITDRGLTIVPGVSFEEWSEAFSTICGMHRVAMWALGDCVRLGFEMFNEDASQIVDGYAPETTKVALWVSERIEPARRHPSQSWSAHRAVASLPPAEQDEILALAEANGWHSREVGAEVKRRKAKPANDIKLLPDQRNWPQVDEGEPIGEEITRVIDETVTMPLADYKRLLEAAEADDMIVWCETCGAWLDRDDPATCTADDFTGCWKAATRREEDSHLCRSYRALEAPQRGEARTA